MKPIGLAFKGIDINPYTGRTSGELMVVHLCLNCDKISYNRIAGDDNTYSLTKLFKETGDLNLDPNLAARLRNLNIRILTQEDSELVFTALYGYDYEKYLT